MAIEMSGDMVGSILRSGGNSFRVNRMGTPPARSEPREEPPAERAEIESAPEGAGDHMREPSTPRPVPSEATAVSRPCGDLKNRSMTTSVTIDSSDAQWLKSERVRRRVEGEEGPYSASGILMEALSESLERADSGCEISDCSLVGSGGTMVRVGMTMSVETWLRANEAAERYRADGVPPSMTRLSCFVRKGLEIIRGE